MVKSMKEVRIVKSGHGGFTVQTGVRHDGGEVFRSGYTMPAFIVYDSTHCDTMEEAEKIARDREEALEDIDWEV